VKITSSFNSTFSTFSTRLFSKKNLLDKLEKVELGGGGVSSVASFQPATSGQYTLVNFNSKVNSGSDKGFNNFYSFRQTK